MNVLLVNDPFPLLQVPVPDYRALPHEPRCQDESLIVCSNGHIQGRQVRGPVAGGRVWGLACVCVGWVRG